MNSSNPEIVAQLRVIKRLLMVIAILLAVIIGILNVEVLKIVIVAALLILVVGLVIRFLTIPCSENPEKQID